MPISAYTHNAPGLSGPPDDADDLELGAFVERLIASPSFREVCAAEQPDVAIEACAESELALTLRYLGRACYRVTPAQEAEACDDLCRAYERRDRAQPIEQKEAA